jgi:hypothetical protein
LPATKLIPLRIDRNVLGYYYISDGARVEDSGQRKNSGMNSFNGNGSSTGYDTMYPDRVMCERLATKIINGFDMKFMRNNTALHEQIVSILQAHRFNESLMRFIFIPANHVHKFAVNRDGNGKGHSMLEPGLVTARMYMFLKMYCLLYQINNGAIRVYNVRTSGMDKNFRNHVQSTMKKFTSRRITANDVFNHNNAMNRMSAGSELVMPLGSNDTAPITIDKIDAAESPLDKEFLESLKTEAINANSVPSMMITDRLGDVDFAAEIKEANSRFFSMVGGYKLDLNKAITKFYRFLMRHETELQEDDIRSFKFAFNVANKKQVSITSEMIQSFQSEFELLTKFVLTAEENKAPEGEEMSDVAREFGKLLLQKRIPDIDLDEMHEFVEKAKLVSSQKKLNNQKDDGNLVDGLPENTDDQTQEEETL